MQQGKRVSRVAQRKNGRKRERDGREEGEERRERRRGLGLGVVRRVWPVVSISLSEDKVPLSSEPSAIRLGALRLEEEMEYKKQAAQTGLSHRSPTNSSFSCAAHVKW